MERLLDFDPLSGLKTYHSFDEASETTIIRYEGDSQGVLDQCREDVNHADRRHGEMVHAARVPPEVQLEWYVKYGVRMWDRDHRGKVHRLLDGEYKHLKRLPIIIGNY